MSTEAALSYREFAAPAQLDRYVHCIWRLRGNPDVRFHPWAAAPLLGFTAADLRDQLPPLGEVLPELAHRLTRVAEESTEHAQLSALVKALTERVRHARALEERVGRLVTHIVSATQPFTMRGLARDVGLSVRRVQRLFTEDVGLSPKQLHRINRFRSALRLRKARPQLTWSAIAAPSGYFDHAHLVHDAHDLAGRVPSDLLGSSGMTEAFLS